jgi:outer membrane protein assembly factor BamD
MSRRFRVIILLGSLAFTLACTNKKVNNPLANVGSKQPDKVLFDRAMDAMKHNKFDVSRLTLQTLINTYPDSEYIARAKLAVADSWYAEGGSAALSQAEIEYKDFETFFPNMPEAAEAQLKIANIHYQQMEKPDRDYTHAMRAEEEYRQLILQYPDSKLLPEAKQRLLEVQEVLAEREFRVGRFYYLRESYPAAIARLRSVVDKYPLYSSADEALYLLGQAYEGEITTVRGRKIPEAAKARMIQDFNKGAADAYSRILTRYPLMNRADDAKARLEALHQPVPRPTKAAVAQNKAEEDSRRETGTFGRLISNFRKHPDVAQAAKVGDPTLIDPTPVSATEVVQQATRAMMGNAGASGKNSVSVETVGSGAPPPDQPAPRSDQPAADTTATPPEDSAVPAAGSGTPPPAGELTPNAPADPNELKPNVPDNGSQTLPPPQQVNEIPAATPNQGTASSNTAPATAAEGKTSDTATSADQQKEDEATVSSSKRKKKKGLKKIIPF